MIKEALEYVIGLGNTRIEKDGNRLFSTQKIYEVDAPIAAAIQLRSLTGLVEYLKSEFDGKDKLLIHVASPVEVKVYSGLNRDLKRSEFIKTNPMIPSFEFDRFHDPENFVIRIQSCFVQNEDRDIVLKVVGNIKEEAVSQVGDDGVSQAVVAKTGVATVSNVKVPNPVALKPYRTFLEVDQPESDFIFRMHSGPKCALFEADGGAWKLEAMERVKKYLESNLRAEINSARLVILA